MKAAIYPGEGRPVIIETLPDPEPAAGEVLIKVDRCGICGTDLAMTRGGAWDFGSGVQFGHEYAGEVVALGSGVSSLAVGDRIAVLPSTACGECPGCAHQNNVLCRASPGRADHGFAQYARVPVSVATRLPAVLSLADGALIEPMAISLYGVKHARIQPGDRVVVLGGGTVALYAVYWARRLGAGRIVVLSRSARRAELALQMGADRFIPYGENEVGEVAETLGGPPEVVLECVGAQGMLGKAIMHAGPFGRVVSLGFCTSPDPVIPAIASYKCVSVQFLVGYSMAEFLTIADQMDKGHVDPKAIITSTVPLAALPETMTMLRGPNEETKVHVTMA
ncbi:threonine dehydrogenase-like Zn-dependent dehydrogenase [Novosphingobium chloroacetimidivorans]|uniref:Threonine dehydrogenase-like Zn-dependent dehydrogenase n=1 Tax=Novosphingobium chloroacetimidivorans TaxID=1428314 RepID=A0A7W7KB81_9SPHN|nr:alcohol dehydrogenase catalytic domain-containing protein [Novosphingobium chloroacetimidivorans]MBB4859395.1 threonine dehydrogenase-like Zn-dependent dehydrogenase [Novosphingobium chloroacetimidivorans]